MYSFEKNNVLITGGSSGIGKALAKRLAMEGANVAIVGRNKEKLNSARSEIEAVRKDKGQKIEALSADVSHYPEIEAAVKGLVERGWKLDMLINSAGVVYAGYFESIPLEEFRRVMDIDYFGTLYTVRAVIPHFLSTGSGKIVNISSAAGYFSLFGYTPYCPAKFAVTALSEALRQEYKARGVEVFAVFPPDVRTPQLEEDIRLKPAETAALTASGGKPMEPDEVARIILKSVKAKRYLIIPGFMNKVAYLLAKTPLARWITEMTVSKVQRNKIK